MFHLIYTSRETQQFGPAHLKKLLMGARMRNLEGAVTGMLVFHDGTFLQALEGEEAAVRLTFSRIEKDSRHRDITVLHRNASLGKRRIFGEWSMGYADATGAANVLKGFIDVGTGLTPEALDGVRAMEILKACSQPPLRESA